MARETVIASFVLRFVKPAAAGDCHSGAACEGGPSSTECNEMRIAVRHVQSGYERRFTRIDDAVGFIREEISLLEQE